VEGAAEGCVGAGGAFGAFGAFAAGGGDAEGAPPAPGRCFGVAASLASLFGNALLVARAAEGDADGTAAAALVTGSATAAAGGGAGGSGMSDVAGTTADGVELPVDDVTCPTGSRPLKKSAPTTTPANATVDSTPMSGPRPERVVTP
jgi:hypothetical protein